MAVRPVLELAVRSGLQRVVLLSSSAVEPSAHGLGGLQRLVSDLVPEWAILRPSWFVQNFTGDHPLAHALRAGLVRSATGRGRIGFVDTHDIADVAVELLARDEAVHDDFVLTGPEALSYADVCDLAGGVYGWRIEHESIPVQDHISALQDAGVPAAFAEILAAMDDEISRGAEDRITDVVNRVTGHAARTFEALLRQEHARPLAAGPTS